MTLTPDGRTDGRTDGEPDLNPSFPLHALLAGLTVSLSHSASPSVSQTDGLVCGLSLKLAVADGRKRGELERHRPSRGSRVEGIFFHPGDGVMLRLVILPLD